MAWLLLALAIAVEVVATTAMKLSEGFSRLAPTVVVFVGYAIAFILLILVLKRLDLSVTYAVWSGVGTAAVAVIGFVWFGEAVTALKVGSIALIVIGVMGLNLAGSGH